MVLTEKQFKEAKARGEFGEGVTYRMYLSFTEFNNRKTHNRTRREQEEARNRATSLYDIKFKN